MRCGNSGKSGSKLRFIEKCGRDGVSLKTYKAVVKEYLEVHAPRFDRYHDFIKKKSKSGPKPFKSAIEISVMAEHPDYKRHPHQWRLSKEILSKAKSALLNLEIELKEAKDFDEIFKLVAAAFGKVPGVGQLAVYDTALRIGNYRKLLPQSVYLHAGALKGAKALGLKFKGHRIEPGDLPAEFHALRPDQIEDCLCIFKEDLARIYLAKFRRQE